MLPIDNELANRTRWILPCFGIAALGLAAIAFNYRPATYFLILRVLILTPHITPFIDAQFIPAMVECWNRGINVYVTAPCDPLQRIFAYSPLWLRLSFLTGWSNWMGVGLDCAFFLSLAILPQPRKPSGIAWMTLALFSSMSVFALERGNIDLIMFLLIITGGWCWMRVLKFRLAAYAMFALAGLLKFYPLVLFLLFVRERFRTFIGLCLAGAALVASFVWRFHGELHEMAGNLPVFSNFTDAFGSRQLPDGLPTALRYFYPGLSFSGFSVALWLALTAAAAIFAWRLASRADVRLAFAGLAANERCYLVIGATLFCGCFFAVENGSYRGIHFLFVLPGMLALGQAPGIGRIFHATAASIIFVMWALTIQLFVAAFSNGAPDPMGGSAAIYIYWIVNELAWWWIISVLLGVLFCFIAQSPVWAAITSLRRGRAQAARV